MEMKLNMILNQIGFKFFAKWEKFKNSKFKNSFSKIYQKFDFQKYIKLKKS
jgi:hypothetical protein